MQISQQFEETKEFWAYLLKNGLIKSDIPESRGYGGFPLSGHFLIENGAWCKEISGYTSRILKLETI